MRLGAPLVVGLLMIATMYLVQTLAVTAVVLLVRSELRRSVPGTWRRSVLVAGRVLAAMTVAQFVQIAGWAAVFVACGEFDDFVSAFYHSAVNFTTLGYGDVVMSPAWKLLGPLEAVAGMLMFGVSAAVLFAVIDVLIRRDPAVVPLG
jgi:Ion channel